MRLPLRNFPSILIIGFWLIMMSLLIIKEFVPIKVPPQEIRFPKEMPYIKNWGIYTKARKIGYLKTELNLKANEYLWENDVILELLPDNPFSVKSTAVFSNDRRLKDFHICLAYENLIADLNGVVKENALNLLVKTNKDKTEYTLPWYADNDIMSNGILPWFYISGLKSGDKFQWHILNPLTRKKDLIEVVVKRTSFYYYRNNFEPVMVADMYYQDMKIEFWVDNKGDTLKVITPWGWELEAE